MKIRRHDKEFFGIILRYLLLVLVALPNLWLFYAVFTPLTVYPSYIILSWFFNAALVSKDIILINGLIPIELIKACIAGSAYYLLLILNLSVPGVKIGKRLLMIFSAFATLLILNVIRIVILVAIYLNASPLFNLTHEIFWYALSTVFVAGIWFTEVSIFRINNLPIVSDIKFLARCAKSKR